LKGETNDSAAEVHDGICEFNRYFKIVNINV